MAISDVLEIERLGPADVSAALALSDAVGWNQTAADWSFFMTMARTFGIRDDAGVLIASATALPYDERVGWISMVLVDAAHRHRGLARQLVGACVASLRDSGRMPVLDATPAGAAVYAKLGFVGDFSFERWEGQGAAAVVAAGGVRAASAADTAALIDLDRRAGGVDRAPLLRAFLARPDTRAWLAASGDGFALRRAGRRATQVGPIVAAADSTALDLLAAALAGVDGRVFIDVSVQRAALATELSRRSFGRQRAFVRMALGDARAAATRDAVFALAGPEFG